ncbi:MAG: 2-C-methyl-D-erythritol 2,4-cyclodiphosphate synthase [Acidimicrobiia bacterium]|nr:MAG: 2-C-methyl-D-erythritol 2,4-cyclodiphosphate synthase [Acidimicrobiia bacterium]
MKGTRVGFGFDAHRFGGSGPIVVCGVDIDHPVGVLATSDGDVASHAVCDALLGAAALGDLGMHFPSGDPQWQDARSLDLVAACAQKVRAAGFDISHVDVTVVAQNVRISPHRSAMRAKLGGALDLPATSISVKATTTDGLGWIGSDKGMAAHAVVTVYR